MDRYIELKGTKQRMVLIAQGCTEYKELAAIDAALDYLITGK